MTTINLTKRSGDRCVSVSLSELLQLSSSAKQLSLAALRPKSTHSGQRVSRLLARGMEFAESRRYQSGDDIRNMDWRVTARTGKAHTKLFAVEKERQVLLALDLRSPMFFATKGVFKSVQASLIAGTFGWKAIHMGDRFGGMIFDNDTVYECRPALGKKGLFPFLHEMAERTHSPQQKKVKTLTESESSIDRAIAGIRKMATPGSLVFVVSDFRNLSSDSCDALLQISRHCDLHLCFIYDSFEAALPINAIYPVTSGGRELQLNTYDKNKLLRYHQQYLERRNKIANLSQHRHISFMECSTEEDFLLVLRKCFN